MPSASASFMSLCSVAATYSTASSCTRAVPHARRQQCTEMRGARCACQRRAHAQAHQRACSARASAAAPATARVGTGGTRRSAHAAGRCGWRASKAAPGRRRRGGGARARAAATARLQREAVRGLAVGGVQVQRVRALEGGQARVGQHARVEAEVADVHVAPPARQREQQLRRAGAVVGVHQRHLHRPAQAWRAVLWVW